MTRDISETLFDFTEEKKEKNVKTQNSDKEVLKFSRLLIFFTNLNLKMNT